MEMMDDIVCTNCFTRATYDLSLRMNKPVVSSTFGELTFKILSRFYFNAAPVLFEYNEFPAPILISRQLSPVQIIDGKLLEKNGLQLTLFTRL